MVAEPDKACNDLQSLPGRWLEDFSSAHNPMKLYERTRLANDQKIRVVIDVASGIPKKDVAKRYEISLRTLYSILKTVGPSVLRELGRASAEIARQRGEEVKKEL